MKLNVHPSWKPFFDLESKKPYFSELMLFIDEVYSQKDIKCFPPKHQVFRLFETLSLEEIKVVIIGQDPYPTVGHANGLAFSLNENVQPLAKSLINIYKELSADLEVSPPKNGDLTFWMEQGVFLLNTVLTVEEGRSMSHKNRGWEIFTTAVLDYLSEKNDQLVFLLWGSFAQQKFEAMDQGNHYSLVAPHPSPLSAYRGFFGCKHFSKTNDFLRSVNKQEIIWTNSKTPKILEFDFK